MFSSISQLRYEAISPGCGWVVISVTEETGPLDCFGELPAGRPSRRRRRHREIVLKVESNLPDFTGLMPWERELLAPVVTRLLEDVLREEALAGEEHEGSPRQED